MESREYSPLAAQTKNEPFFTCQKLIKNQRKENNKNSKRFSDEQIELLESMFKVDTKLEPRKKLHLARELGLQPRQVAIWFQNRRARWKFKQMEQDYRVLKANYDTLNSQFESLKNEQQSLLRQLNKLQDQLVKMPHEGNRESKSVNIADGGGDLGNAVFEFDKNHGFLTEKLNQDVVMRSANYQTGNIGYFSQEEELGQLNFRQENETELLKLSDQVDSLPGWRNNDSSALYHHSCSTSNWWDF